MLNIYKKNLVFVPTFFLFVKYPKNLLSFYVILWLCFHFFIHQLNNQQLSHILFIFSFNFHSQRHFLLFSKTEFTQKKLYEKRIFSLLRARFTPHIDYAVCEPNKKILLFFHSFSDVVSATMSGNKLNR